MEAVIFDLDGVICFTDEYHFLAWKAVADEIGVMFDREINNRLRGVSRMESLEIILEMHDKVLTAAEKLLIADRKNETYKKYLERLTPTDVAEGALDLLGELKHRGIRVAVGSSSKNAKYILEKLGIADMFDAVADGNDITRSKPDPEVFLRAAEKMKILPSQCLVVEDAVAGIDAAKAGGFVAVGIGDAKDYEKCDYRIKTLAELLKAL